MEILVVRHGESEGNAEHRMQGSLDLGLTERGRDQARRLAAWLLARARPWTVAYCSPLVRASETAAILAAETGWPAAAPEPDLAELRAGRLEGLTRDDIAERYPAFLERAVMELADFSAFGGESYDEAQARAERFLETLVDEHRGSGDRVLVVGHGGMNFQIVKRLVCTPVPRLCILRMGNCSATLIRMRDRRGTYLGEVVWHLPIELTGGAAGEGSAAVFR